MFARIVYYIRSETLGLFVGEMMGLGFFTCHVESGLLTGEDYMPIQFFTEEEAQTYLDLWIGGKGDCFVEEGIG